MPLTNLLLNLKVVREDVKVLFFVIDEQDELHWGDFRGNWYDSAWKLESTFSYYAASPHHTTPNHNSFLVHDSSASNVRTVHLTSGKLRGSYYANKFCNLTSVGAPTIGVALSTNILNNVSSFTYINSKP